MIVIQDQEAWEGTLEVSSCGGIKVPSHLSPGEEENNTLLLPMLWALHMPGKRFPAEIHTPALRHRLDG